MVNRQTFPSINITFPRTTYAGGKNTPLSLDNNRNHQKKPNISNPTEDEYLIPEEQKHPNGKNPKYEEHIKHKLSSELKHLRKLLNDDMASMIQPLKNIMDELEKSNKILQKAANNDH